MKRERGIPELALGKLLGHTGISRIFDQMDWAEDEIKEAMKRHPDSADVLYHSFTIMTATTDFFGEKLYRAHCGQLLDRLAAGGDVKAGTDAEMIAACSATSQITPLTTAATALYLRVWNRTFLDEPQDDEHIKHVNVDETNMLERELRRKLRKRDRVIGAIDCGGYHWGELAPECTFRKAS